MKLWMFQWCIADHMTLQFKWTMSLCWLRYDLRSVYISVSFDRFRFNFDLRLDYQECCGCQPETQYRVNTKDGPLSLLHRGFRSCQLFSWVFWSPFCEKAFAQDDESRSVWVQSNIKCEFLAIRALAKDTAINEVIKLPLFWRAHKKFWTISSKLPNKSGRPLSKTFRFGAI